MKPPYSPCVRRASRAPGPMQNCSREENCSHEVWLNKKPEGGAREGGEKGRGGSPKGETRL